MAIAHVNGFGTYPINGDFLTPINATSGASTYSRQPGRGAGGYALRHTNTTASANALYTARLVIPATVALGDFSLGFAMNHRATFTPGSALFGVDFIASSTTEIRFGTGVANVYFGSSGTSAFTVLNATPSSIGWHWWNIVHKYHASAGYTRVYRDGTLLAEQAPDTVPSNLWTGVAIILGNDNGGAKADLADLIIRNDATIIPDSRVDTLFPDGTSAGGWLGSDGDSTNNHLLINENPDHGAGTYVGAATVGTLDTYTLGNLPSTASAVHAVQVGARATKSDGGAKTLSVLADINESAAKDPGGAGTVYGVFELNAGAAWTTATVNSATAGIKVAS